MNLELLYQYIITQSVHPTFMGQYESQGFKINSTCDTSKQSGAMMFIKFTVYKNG